MFCGLVQVTFKSEIIFYPGVGTAMLLAGYLPVKRGDKESGKRSGIHAFGCLARHYSISQNVFAQTAGASISLSAAGGVDILLSRRHAQSRP